MTNFEGEWSYEAFSSEEKALEAYKLSEEFFQINCPSPYEIIELGPVDRSLRNLRRMKKEKERNYY
jgi:hypothetical protein